MTELSIELSMLLWATILYVVQIFISAGAADLHHGVAWGLGNREESPAIPGWAGRAERAYKNMTENLLPFACLVLIAVASERLGDLSAMGAQLFVASRVLHGILYIAGIKVLRSLAYGGGLAGMGMIAAQIL